MNKDEKAGLLIIFGICLLFCALCFWTGYKIGKINICIDNHAIFTGKSCVFKPDNIPICTINGKPYTVDADAQIVPGTYPDNFNITWQR